MFEHVRKLYSYLYKFIGTFPKETLLLLRSLGGADHGAIPEAQKAEELKDEPMTEEPKAEEQMAAESSSSSESGDASVAPAAAIEIEE